MTIERTCTQIVSKPWGSTDLRPWNARHGGGAAIGEIWFQRIASAPDCALLLKLLFTTEPLSIQVHPDDAFARSIGLAHGKSEAWYILSATADARVALGLKRPLTRSQLRGSIDDGSIAQLIQWRSVAIGDAIFVSPGTIHAIGAGLVLVEVQQRSDATFRLFDYGRQRQLHADKAVAAASAEQAGYQAPPRQLSSERTLLSANPHFVFERFELSPASDWELLATTETWLFVFDGHARVGSMDVGISEAIFLEAEITRIQVRSDGLKCVVAYVGSDAVPELLQRLDASSAHLPQFDAVQALYHSRPSAIPISQVQA